MTEFETQVIAELIRIRKCSEALAIHLGAGKSNGNGRSASQSNGSSRPVVPEIASDEDLDGEHGDPEIRKDPPRWKGESTAPIAMSQASPEYLDCVAEFKLWQAGKEDEKGEEGSAKNAWYRRWDAAKAKGWARRRRAEGAEPIL